MVKRDKSVLVPIRNLSRNISSVVASSVYDPAVLGRVVLSCFGSIDLTKSGLERDRRFVEALALKLQELALDYQGASKKLELKAGEVMRSSVFNRDYDLSFDNTLSGYCLRHYGDMGVGHHGIGVRVQEALPRLKELGDKIESSVYDLRRIVDQSKSSAWLDEAVHILLTSVRGN